jgi:hypothetical protein
MRAALDLAQPNTKHSTEMEVRRYISSFSEMCHKYAKHNRFSMCAIDDFV